MSTVELEQQRLFIGGEWTEASGAATFARTDPFTGAEVTLAAAGTAEDAAARGRRGARRVPRLGRHRARQSGARCCRRRGRPADGAARRRSPA